MPQKRHAGTRIREKRLDLGLKQAAVAETVGISPSYLNLIEHNRRRIGGKLLSDLARVLGVDTALLADGVDTETLDHMRNAAAKLGGTAEIERTEELAARYPGWAALIAAQSRQINRLEEKSKVLSDRITHDPQLAGALHDLISAVSAIRSTASILVGPEVLDSDWQRRFHDNIHKDSLRLAQSSELLIGFLEAPDEIGEQTGTAREAVERFLGQSGFHVARIEEGAAPEEILPLAGLKGPAQEMLRDYLQAYAAHATMLPMAGFEAAARELAYDPIAIAGHFGVPFSTVLVRMAQLPTGQGHPPIGLAMCDASGTLTLLKQAAGFSLPNAGGACPLWPLYLAFGRPHQPVRQLVELPGPTPARFLCYAVATPQTVTAFDVPSSLQSVMLVMPDPPEQTSTPQPVGMSCRICPRQDCVNRREPAIAGVSPRTVL